MSFEAKLIALLDSMTPRQIAAMRPVDRQQLAAQLQRVHRLTEAADASRRSSGVLADLGRGHRAH